MNRILAAAVAVLLFSLLSELWIVVFLMLGIVTEASAELAVARFMAVTVSAATIAAPLAFREITR